MKILALAAAAGIVLSGFATAVLAEDGDSKFLNADGNKDNMVSMAEAQGTFPTLTQTLFDQADANHDGNLDAAEFTSLEGLTAGVDSNGGGSSAASSSSSQ